LQFCEQDWVCLKQVAATLEPSTGDDFPILAALLHAVQRTEEQAYMLYLIWHFIKPIKPHICTNPPQLHLAARNSGGEVIGGGDVRLRAASGKSSSLMLRNARLVPSACSNIGAVSALVTNGGCSKTCKEGEYVGAEGPCRWAHKMRLEKMGYIYVECNTPLYANLSTLLVSLKSLSCCGVVHLISL
jgi:hypothetical protein